MISNKNFLIKLNELTNNNFTKLSPNVFNVAKELLGKNNCKIHVFEKEFEWIDKDVSNRKDGFKTENDAIKSAIEWLNVDLCSFRVVRRDGFLGGVSYPLCSRKSFVKTMVDGRMRHVCKMHFNHMIKNK